MLTEEQKKRYNAKKLEWHYKNHDREKKRMRECAWRRRYGISRIEYDQMLTDQGGVCKICHYPETTTYKGIPRHLSVDHDHKTGAIRGLLCVKCNVFVGLVEEDPTVLKLMFVYLNQHNVSK